MYKYNLGQAPARQAALGAGLPESAQATTVNKVCGSGMQTAIMGSEALASGKLDFVVAGGMESMSNAPYLLKKHRAGARAGHDTVYDHVFLDGLEDAYDPGKAMGEFAQATADEYQLSQPTAPYTDFPGDRGRASWLVNAAYAADWQAFQRDGAIATPAR